MCAVPAGMHGGGLLHPQWLHAVFHFLWQQLKRLDAHGFAPFGEVIEGVETIDALGRVLGNAYREMQDLCPAEQTPATGAYCIYNAGVVSHRCGVAGSELVKPGAEAYVRSLFPLMYEARVRSVVAAAALLNSVAL